ncbi:MAG: hypothetical protein PUJ13_01145 [Bacteroidales bacterium]|nr:hypothetical protein [Bacteroidales bacterium]
MAQLAARNPCGVACTTLTGRYHLVVMHHRDDSPTLSAQEEAARASDANIMKIPKKPSKESCQFAYFFMIFRNQPTEASAQRIFFVDRICHFISYCPDFANA